MNLVLFMIFLTFLLVAGFVIGFLWAASHGQFDDLITPAFRMLENDNNDNEEGFDLLISENKINLDMRADNNKAQGLVNTRSQ